MGFLGNILSATVKTVLTPVAIVSDAASAMSGEDMEATKAVLGSALEDIADACEDAKEGDLL